MVLSPSGGLDLYILMLLQRSPGLLLLLVPKKGDVLKSFLPPQPGLLLPNKGDLAKILKNFLPPLVPVKDGA